MSPTLVVQTRPREALSFLTSPATITVVGTVADGFNEIGDDELLALAAPQIVALVRRGPHEAELLFVSVEHEPAVQEN